MQTALRRCLCGSLQTCIYKRHTELKLKPNSEEEWDGVNVTKTVKLHSSTVERASKIASIEQKSFQLQADICMPQLSPKCKVTPTLTDKAECGSQRLTVHKLVDCMYEHMKQKRKHTILTQLPYAHVVAAV